MLRLLAALLLLCGIARADTVQNLPIFVQPLPTTCSASVCPNGVPAPSGFHWVLTSDDEFTQYSSLPPGWICSNPCNSLTFDTTNGMTLQPIGDGVNRVDVTVEQSGLTQRYGFWEFLAQVPNDRAGEGDGYHYDIYFNNLIGNPDQAGYREVDMDEGQLSTGNQDYTSWSCCGSPQTVQTNYPANGIPLANNFHTFGTWWFDDGSDGGLLTGYFDGAQISGAQGAQDGKSAWGSGGGTVLITNRECDGLVFNGGVACDSSTSNNSPFHIRYARVWQLAPN
jgi:hypothetical protein